MKKFFEYINKINIKIFLSSIVLALVFICFSPHLFVKTEYWQNKYPQREFFFGTLYINFDDLNKESENLTDNSILLKSVDSSINTALKPIKRIDKDSFYYVYYTTIVPWQTSSFLKIEPMFNTPLTLKTWNNNSKYKIVYDSYRINGKEYKNIINKGQKITLEASKGNIINIDFKAKYKTIPKKFFKSVNWWAFSFVALCYWVFFLILIKKITNIGLKTCLYNIISLIKRNRYSILIFFLFFIFYLFTNYYAGTHINHLIRPDIVLGGDSNVYLLNTMQSLTRRYHPWAFLPLYPLFDFIFMFTKNLFTTMILIYILITSISVTILYKILELINSKNHILNILLTMIYGFSYGIITSVYGYDNYVYTAFYLCIITYLIICELKSETKSYLRISIIGLLTAFSFGVTIANIFTILILFIPFLCSKTRIKQYVIFLVTFILFSGMCLALKNATNHGDATNSLLYKDYKNNIITWTTYNLKDNYKNFINTTLSNSVVYKTKSLSNIFTYSWLIILLLGLILSFAQSKKIDIEDRKIFYSFVVALIYNLISVIFWDSAEGLLFTPNHLALWFIVLGYSIKFIDISLSKYMCLQKYIPIYIAVATFVILQIGNNYHQTKLYQKELIEQNPISIDIMGKHK